VNASNQAQIDLWDGRVGEKWAALQISLDAMLADCTAELTARAGRVAGLRVLDIGCGTGETCTIWLADGADVTGVDVSAPMLAVAEARTGGEAKLIQADASVWKGDAPFDLAVSQFGVMFFSDPEAAFANIAANVRPGGRMLFTCWRPAAENQWVSTPMAAVRDLLPEGPPAVPHAPGPFALCDRDRLQGILERAGFAQIRIDPFDFPIYLENVGGLEPAVRLAMQIGPTGSALAEASREVRAAAADRLREALAPHVKDGCVTLGGAVWVVEAVRQG
jgi:SAM-dependent methyltransferase